MSQQTKLQWKVQLIASYFSAAMFQTLFSSIKSLSFFNLLLNVLLPVHPASSSWHLVFAAVPGRKSWIWINWIIFIWFSISYLSRLIRLIMSCIFGCGAPCIFKLMFSVRCRQQRETWILINSLPKCLFMMGPPLKRICSLTKLQRKFHWDGNLRNSKIIPHFSAFFFEVSSEKVRAS